MEGDRYTIDELTGLTGATRRTIRFYVERGLLAPPAGRGRGGFYGADHLARLQQILAERAQGKPLSRLGDQEPPPVPAHKPQPLVRWTLGPGLTLDVEPALARPDQVEALLAFAQTLLKE